MENPVSSRPAFVLGLAENGLGVVRDLGRAGITVIAFSFDKSAPENFSRYCRTIYCKDIFEYPEHLLKLLIFEAKNFEKKPVLFPTGDQYLEFVLENRTVIEKHFELPVADTAIVFALLDKYKMFLAAKNAGVLCPKTILARKNSELCAAAKKIGFPCLVKPAFQVDWKNKNNPVSDKAIRIDSQKELAAITPEKTRGTVVQEIIPGPISNIFSYGAYFGKNRKQLVEFSSKMIEEHPKPFGSGIVIETVFEKKVLQNGRKFMEAAKYFGPVEIEMKKDSTTNEIKIVEVNPRLWWNHQLSASCCESVSLIAFRELDGSLKQSGRPKAQNGKFIWIKEKAVAYQLLRRIMHGNFPAKKAFSLLKEKKVFATFAFDDPLPGIIFLLELPFIIAFWLFCFLQKR